MFGLKSPASEDRLGWIRRARESLLLGFIVLAVFAPAGCSLLLDPGDHYLQDGNEAGPDASPDAASAANDDAEVGTPPLDGDLEMHAEDAGAPDGDAGDEEDVSWKPDGDGGDEADAP